MSRASAVGAGVAGEPDPFDLTQPSPLPRPLPASAEADDDLIVAERSVARADRGADRDERVRSRVAFADAAVAQHLVGPALDALRAAEKLDPENLDVLDRLARVLPRASMMKEAAVARREIARLRPTPATLHASACAWLRTDDHAAAQAALDELSRAAPEDPRTASLLVTFARLRGGPSSVPMLVATLLDCAAHARKREDRERWREHALNAWIESKGADGGELLAEALASTGRPRAAVYVAAEAAARALLGAPPDLAAASKLLVRCARLAESAGLPGEAASAWTVHALLPANISRDARESLRDVLAEQGRSIELAARLRADARRAPPAARSAAWKGVAAIEIGVQPSQAAHALAEAIRSQPDDSEALELLEALAEDITVSAAVRDALWGVVRDATIDRAARTRLLLWLAQLEEQSGDPVSGETALAAIDDPAREAFEGLARLHERAEQVVARAEQALAALEVASHEDGAALDAFLSEFFAVPGAFRDGRRVAKVLGPWALRDERAATLWFRVARRLDDLSQLTTALYRVATRAEPLPLRVRATLERAELPRRRGAERGGRRGLALLLDEAPSEPAVAAALAGLAEHSAATALSADALRAVANASTDAWERDFLRRFDGRSDGIFAVFASCLSEPAATKQRCDELAQLHDLVGDSAALLALRTRALMAQSGSISQALEVSRRFAAFAPLSPEATIAWFGAANVAGDIDQVADAAVAAVRSLASVRDVSAITRTAMARLETLGAPERARQLAVEAVGAVGLADRALRTAVLELLRRSKDAPEVLPLVEHLAACAGAVEEQVASLRSLVDGYRRKGAATLEVSALWRLRAHAKDHTTERLLVLLPRVGDHARMAQLLSEQLDAVRDPVERRQRLLAIASEYAAADPPLPTDAIECIDRIAQEQPTAEVQGLAVRALIALGQPEAAVGRLLRWSTECGDAEAVARMRCATRVARDVMRAPARALLTLRTLLRRMPGDHESLLVAEELAIESASFDTIFAIYNDLSSIAAGEHARHAIAYQRACLLERAGRVGVALDEQFVLFMKAPALGASFSAVERLAERTGRYDVLVRALGLLATHASAPEVRARYYLQTAEVARTRSQDTSLSLMLELLSFQSSRDAATEALLRRHARELRPLAPDAARIALEQLVDEALSAANQTWDDNARRTHALHALELTLSDLDDVERASEAASLFLKQHDDPPAARRAVIELLDGNTPSDRVRSAVTALLPEDSAVAVARKPAEEGDIFASVHEPERPPPAAPPAAPPVAPPRPSVVRDTFRPPTQPSMRPIAPRPSERPSQMPPRVGRASQRPPKQPFNPRAAMQAGYPIRSATPLFTPSGSVAPRRPSTRPPAAQSSPPSVAVEPLREPVIEVPHVAVERGPKPPSSSPPEITYDAAPASIPPPPNEDPPPATAPPPASQAVTQPPVAPPSPAVPPPLPPRAVRPPRVKMTVSALREAADSGDDQAASMLARHLSQFSDMRDEALLIQRRRFEQDPTRLDALESLIELYASLRMRLESAAIASVHAVLTGKPLPVWPDPPPVNELSEPLEGVARVLFPPHYGPFPELGTIVWEALNGGRRDATRSQGAGGAERTFVSPANEFGRMFSGAVRLLQLPKATPMVVRTDLADGAEMAAGSVPPTVLVALTLAHDTPRSRFLIGVTLESTRVGHLPVTALGPADGERLVAAVRAAFGPAVVSRLDPTVARLATRVFEALPPRTQRHAQELVAQLGDKLSWQSWREAVAHAQMHAGMLVCGDFRTAAENILLGAPSGVPRDPAAALASYPPLRALARFAVSEEYLLLRWQPVRHDRW
ncbi:MAG: hypothetical protein U0326_32745 [Polyangiales bacterium]